MELSKNDYCNAKLLEKDYKANGLVKNNISFFYIKY